MKRTLFAFLLLSGMMTEAITYTTPLKHVAVPANVTMTFSGTYSTGDAIPDITVVGPAVAATLDKESLATSGWRIAAASPVGYKTPKFKVCAYNKVTGTDYTDEAVEYTGTANISYPDVAHGAHERGVYVSEITVEAEKYTVTFDVNSANGQVSPGSTAVTYDATYGAGTAGALPVPTRTGYTFAGWWTERDGGTQVTDATVVKITSAQVLYAHWTPVTYKARFDSNGGTGSMADQTLTYDTAANLTANAFTKENYDFQGWATNNLDVVAYADRASVLNLANAQDAVVTLKALWSGKIYTICYHSNFIAEGATSEVTESATFAYGENCPLHAAFIRPDHEFLGWSRASDATTREYDAGQLVNATTLPFENGVVHLYAVWKADLFSVAFDANGGDGGESMDNLSVAVAEAANVVLPSNKFTNTGCAFAGWALNAAGTGARFGNAEVADLKSVAVKDETVTLYAQWVPYKVTFVAEEGAFDVAGSPVAFDTLSPNAQTATVFYTEGRTYSAFPVATNVNEVKIFKKWSQKRDGVWLPVDEADIVPPLSSGVTNLVAQWGRNDPLADALDAPTLVFSTSNEYDPAGVWTPSSDSIPNATAEGGKAALIQLTLGDYGDTPKEARVTTTLTGPGTLSFRWKIESAQIVSMSGAPTDWKNTCEVLRFGTGTIVTPANFVAGLAADSSRWFVVGDVDGNNVLESGTEPLGWHTTNIVIDAAADATTTVAWEFQYLKNSDSDPAWPGRAWIDNVQWTGAPTVVVPTHTITFDANGGSGTMPDQTVAESGTALNANVFEYAGYTFAGWNTQADGSGVAFADQDVVSAAEDLTLHAQWTANVYTVVFDPNGGSVAPNSTTVMFSAPYGELPTPTLEGYGFDGWFTAADGGTQVTATTTVATPSDHTLYAHWTPIQYTITFDSAGGSAVDAITQGYGNSVAAPADPTRDGYTFVEWQPALPATMPAGDLTVVAQWNVNAYTITFDSAGGSAVAPITQDYGTAVIAPADPTRDGYIFAGWQPALPATMPAGDLTVVAQWTVPGGDPGGGGADEDDPNAAVEGRLFETVEPALVQTADVYDGYLYDAAGNVVGTLQVKRAKYNAQKGLSKVTATVTMVGGKKVSYTGGEWHEGSASVTLSAKNDSRQLTVVLGVRGMTGTYGEYGVDGSVNSFSSKDPATKADGAAVLKSVRGRGALALAIPSDAGWGGLSVEIKAKGKAKVSGTLADGTRVSVSSQLLIGEKNCCLPVVYAKKQTRLAFTIWFSRDGTPIGLTGVENAKLSSVGGLAAGATFAVDSDAMVAALGGTLQVDYLPNGFAVAQAGSKLIVQDGAKSGKVAEANGTWTVTSKNWAALKLSYAAKTSLFKGSFKAYLRQPNGKPKAVSVKVSGVVVDGIGYGAATVSKKTAAVMIGAGQAAGGAQ